MEHSETDNIILTADSYKVEHCCGRNHRVTLDKAVIAPGAMYGLEDLMAEQGCARRFAAVYDENTYQATAGRRPKAAREVVLRAQGLHADEHGVEALQDALGDEGMLVAVGAGTVHDITRYVAAQREIPFISVPTAASVDGFVSTVAAMTLKGFKVTVPAVSPKMLVADLDVVCKAPRHLAASGFGDVLGKFISLADWDISRTVTGEYHCQGIAGLTRQAVDEAVAACGGIAEAHPAAVASLLKALVLSGVAMQLSGNSRPASGAEHHISHLLEIGVPWLAHTDALHGEKVGVGTLLCRKAYGRWLGKGPEALVAARRSWCAPDEKALAPVFGALAPMVCAENRENCLLAVSPESIAAGWPAVQSSLQNLPSEDEMAGLLATVHGKTTLAAIGIDSEKEEDILHWSPLVRNRLTFMRMLQMAPRA